jgi:ectoine hydroxylase-related dioxygenase (phytanoyl-CoA dioxygenase family)
VVDGAFAEAELAPVLAEFNRLWEETIREAEATGTPRQAELARLRPFIGQVHTRSAVCERFVRHPVYLDLCRALIGPDADLYYNQAVLKPPAKGKAFGWHQDSQYIITEPLEYITCWTPITRATVDNGTIWILPGEHRRGLLPHVWSQEASEWQCQADTAWKEPVVLRPGQIAVFTSLLPHASGPNVSDETRAAYVVQFHVPLVRHRDKGEPVGDQYPVLRGGKPARPA